MTILRLLFIAAFALPGMGSPAFAGEKVEPGLYRATEGPDVASMLQIGEDGHFRYMLSVGALDEQAEGYWRRAGDGVALFSDPKPVPPAFSVDAQERTGDAPFSLVVAWPGGQGIAGIDFRLGLASGEVIEGYTQYYGWSLGSEDRGRPAWVELTDPINRISSPRLAIDADVRILRIRYTPNDLGKQDFNGAMVLSREGGVEFHHPDGVIRYVPVRR